MKFQWIEYVSINRVLRKLSYVLLLNNFHVSGQFTKNFRIAAVFFHKHSEWITFIQVPYPASRGFSLALLLAFTKSFVCLACRVGGLFTRREKPLRKAARDFCWACSLEASKILEVHTWLIVFKTGFIQLNLSRASISERFALQNWARDDIQEVEDGFLPR